MLTEFVIHSGTHCYSFGNTVSLSLILHFFLVDVFQIPFIFLTLCSHRPLFAVVIQLSYNSKRLFLRVGWKFIWKRSSSALNFRTTPISIIILAAVDILPTFLAIIMIRGKSISSKCIPKLIKRSESTISFFSSIYTASILNHLSTSTTACYIVLSASHRVINQAGVQLAHVQCVALRTACFFRLRSRSMRSQAWNLTDYTVARKSIRTLFKGEFT